MGRDGPPGRCGVCQDDLGASVDADWGGSSLSYATILADPPWQQGMAGKRRRAKGTFAADALAYPTLSLEQICRLPVGDLAEEGAHLWLWTTNQFLESGFQVMRAWGFKYLCPIHWLKPSGVGNWFVHRTQTVLFGYKDRCRFPLSRYKPNILATGGPVRHSQKPEAFYPLIESVSPAPRLELFARKPRDGWHVWGNEVESDVSLEVPSDSA